MVNDLFLFNDIWGAVQGGEVGGEVEFQPDDWSRDFVDGCALFGDAAFLLKFISKIEIALSLGFVP